MECKKMHGMNNIKGTWLGFYANRSYAIFIFFPLISEKNNLEKSQKNLYNLSALRSTSESLSQDFSLKCF
jgi:hypothetical protein